MFQTQALGKMASKVGVLDNAALYDARSKAVYTRAATGGFFFLLDGSRIPVGGTQRWTSLEGIPMRGSAPYLHVGTDNDESPLGGDAFDEEEMHMAIAASLAGDAVWMEASPPAEAPAAPAVAAAQEGGAAPSAQEGRRCVVCLEDDAPVDHMLNPCHHLCLCAGCAARVRSERMRCPVCRRAQRGVGVVRVFL